MHFARLMAFHYFFNFFPLFQTSMCISCELCYSWKLNYFYIVFPPNFTIDFGSVFDVLCIYCPYSMVPLATVVVSAKNVRGRMIVQKIYRSSFRVFISLCLVYFSEKINTSNKLNDFFFWVLSMEAAL